MCAPARSAARDFAARIRASGDFESGPVQGTDDAVRRVRLLDNLVGSFVKLLMELCRGAVDAGGRQGWGPSSVMPWWTGWSSRATERAFAPDSGSTAHAGYLGLLALPTHTAGDAHWEEAW